MRIDKDSVRQEAHELSRFAYSKWTMRITQECCDHL
jgi:hypothetical protein